MSTMFLDESSGKALVLLVLAVVSVSLIAGSRHQPFPEISGRFGWVLISLTGMLALGETAPRPMSLTLLLVVVLQENMDSMKGHVGHRVEVLLIGVPSSLKTGDGSVGAVELTTLKGDHAGLTPRQGEPTDQEATKHHPGLTAPQPNQHQEACPLFKGVQLRPSQHHQAASARAKHEP